MKTMILLSWLSVLAVGNLNVTTGTSDAQQVLSVVEQFMQNADAQNVQAMEKLLHSDYRAVLNQLFGSDAVSLLDKSTYLKLLESKKIGGDKRSLTVHTLDVQGNNAMVKARFAGQKATFVSYLLLVKDKGGKWLIVSDMPGVG